VSRLMEITGTVSSRDLSDVRILFIPFVVPEGTKMIEISYWYSTGNIIDLGIVDSTFELFPSKKGFRGWSGSIRSKVFIGENTATPGYIGGPILPGMWHVMLGLAKISTKECCYRIEVNFATEAPDEYPSAATSVFAEENNFEINPAWLACDFQSHTEHSDAHATLEETIAAAKAVGLDVLAITDHNTHSQNLSMQTEKIQSLSLSGNRPLLLIPGEELTTYHGHSNVWGLYDWVDFRFSTNKQYQEIIDHIHGRGGLVSINHPKTQPDCIGCDWEFDVPSTIDCMEVWQGPWILGNNESLERYDAALRKGFRIVAVGGSDRHQPGYPDTDPPFLQLGSPTTFVKSKSRTVRAVLDGLKTGSVCISESPQGPTIDIAFFQDDKQFSMGATIPFGIAGGGSIRIDVTNSIGEILQLKDSTGLIASCEITDEHMLLRNIEPKGFVRAEIVVSDNHSYFQKIKKQFSIDDPMSEEFEELWTKIDDDIILRCLSNPIFFASH